MRKAITRRQHDLYFVAFDLLHLNGHDLRDMALQERRDILAGISRLTFASSSARRSRQCDLHLIDHAGLERMVSRRGDTNFRSGPSTSWLKTKCYTVGEFDLRGHLRK
ncbi:hypothetical protein [Mesorhizobium sp. AA22]|uniref:hypothetical protein n=1 Tax=Mesorhizobium sp. AA22 TaxID=1854057 RepID=UPI0007EDAA34|nr:hypothetical protein [Mesorhizobium sp. AA22]QIA24008.1 hypothetical protein A9K68_021150 [Mesorhizobium sp. AA22]